MRVRAGLLGRCGFVRMLLVSLGMSLSTVAGVAMLGVGASAASVLTGRAHGTPVGVASKTLTVSEHGSLHLTSSHGFKLNEEGHASGTLSGPIYLYLTITSSSRVSAEVRFYPHGGYFAGHGTGSYQNSGSKATFSGTLSISQSSGTYAHAHGNDLRFSGNINRKNDDMTVSVSGTLSY